MLIDSVYMLEISEQFSNANAKWHIRQLQYGLYVVDKKSTSTVSTAIMRDLPGKVGVSVHGVKSVNVYTDLHLNKLDVAIALSNNT